MWGSDNLKNDVRLVMTWYDRGVVLKQKISANFTMWSPPERVHTSHLYCRRTHSLPRAKPHSDALNFSISCVRKHPEDAEKVSRWITMAQCAAARVDSLVKWNVSIRQQQHFSALPSSVLKECMRRKRESDRWRNGEVLSEGTRGAYGRSVVLCCVNWNGFHHISPSLQSHQNNSLNTGSFSGS